jgi:HAUS augmin-like complex subunit 1
MERLEVMDAELPSKRLTVLALIQQEQEVLALKEHVLDLEAQARGFQGLPPEKDLARLEVERVQGELEQLEAGREKLYDGMISPK